MKKSLFIAALLCGISFAGNAATNEMKVSAIEKKPMTTTKVCVLYEVTFVCPSGAWSVVCYGYTQAAADAAFDWYRTHAGC